MWREDARWPPLFDIPLKVVCLFSAATHLQTRDTGVMLICFSCRSETSGTKARFSAAEVRDVSKAFTQTLYLTSGWELLQLWCSFQVPDVCLREREGPSKQPLIERNTHYRTLNASHILLQYLFISCSHTTAAPPLPSPPRNPLLQQGVGAAGAPVLTRLRRDPLLC